MALFILDFYITVLFVSYASIAVFIIRNRNIEETRKLYKIVPWLAAGIMVVGAAGLLVFLMHINGFASAAENPTAAPTESAIVVRGYTSCPTTFDPDDSAWAMHTEQRADKKIDEHLLIVEHKRVFSYFPDPEQRIFVGMKKWRNQDCIAEMFSYGSAGGVDQKRVLAAIRSSGKTSVFLLTEKGWETGDSWETFTDYSDERYHLVFTLYRDKIQVASRALPVKPAKRFFHFQFQEPVE